MVGRREWDTRHSRKDWNQFRHMLNLNLVFRRWRGKFEFIRMSIRTLALLESRHTVFIYTHSFHAASTLCPNVQ